MMAFAWLISLGLSPDTAGRELGDQELPEVYRRDIERGYIPADLNKLYSIMAINPEWSLSGCLRELGIDALLTNTSSRTILQTLKAFFFRKRFNKT